MEGRMEGDTYDAWVIESSATPYLLQVNASLLRNAF